jgi:hypothetical protein
MVSQRGLGHVAAHEHDRQAHDRAQAEGQAPAEIDREEAGVEQRERQRGARGGPEPVGPIDGEIDPPARPGGDELVDGRVDRRVLAADSQAGERPEDPERRGAPRERGRDRRDEVHGERDDEELLAPEAIGEIAEADRSDRGADDVARAAEGDLEGAEPQRLLVLQAARDGADDRDLDAVENPHGAQAEDDEPVPAAPRQPVHAARDARRDGLAGARCLHGPRPSRGAAPACAGWDA